jgi:hypothetical protein
VSRIFVALFEMKLAHLDILVLIEIGVLMLMVDLLMVGMLNLLFTSFHILAHEYFLVISLWSP